MSIIDRIIVGIARSKMAKKDEQRLTKLAYPEKIYTMTDIRYMDGKNKFHLFDVKFKEGASSKEKTIVDIHGGGLFYGDKDLNRFYDAELADKGFVVVAPSYRLSPKVKLIDQIQDLFAFFHFLEANISKYPIDINQMYLTGDSAGGFLSALVILINDSKELQELFNVKKFSINFRAMALTCGMMNINQEGRLLFVRRITLGKKYMNVNFYKYLDFSSMPNIKNLIPTYLVTSDEDYLNTMTFYFEEILKQNDIEYKFDYIKKNDEGELGHVFSVLYPKNKYSQQVINNMIDFFLKH